MIGSAAPAAARLGELKELLADDRKMDTRILAMAVHGREDLRRIVDRIKERGPAPGFVLLSDPDHRVTDRHGLFGESYRRPAPHPATLVIDGQGVVRWKFVEENYRIRPTNTRVVAALEAVRNPKR